LRPRGPAGRNPVTACGVRAGAAEVWSTATRTDARWARCGASAAWSRQSARAALSICCPPPTCRCGRSRCPPCRHRCRRTWRGSALADAELTVDELTEAIRGPHRPVGRRTDDGGLSKHVAALAPAHQHRWSPATCMPMVRPPHSTSPNGFPSHRGTPPGCSATWPANWNMPSWTASRDGPSQTMPRRRPGRTAGSSYCPTSTPTSSQASPATCCIPARSPPARSLRRAKRETTQSCSSTV
jgi:hypothetical protein